MEINWTVLTYFIIGLFILNGFFRGWWKEAFTTVILVFFVFLLQQPGVAEVLVDLINRSFNWVWQILPDSLRNFLQNFLESGLGISTAVDGSIQIDPGNPGTWLIFLILFLAVAALISRIFLPDHGSGSGYAVKPIGGVLGGLLGGLNGFVIVNLVREYLDGRNLPGSNSTFPTEVAQAGGGGSIAMASPGVSFQAAEVPSFTILDSFLPWVIIGVGILIFLMAIRNRVKLSNRVIGKPKIVLPYGYEEYGN